MPAFRGRCQKPAKRVNPLARIAERSVESAYVRRPEPLGSGRTGHSEFFAEFAVSKQGVAKIHHRCADIRYRRAVVAKPRGAQFPRTLTVRFGQLRMQDRDSLTDRV
jgi:hypothetical protein